MDYFKSGPGYPGVIIICFLPTVFLTGWRLGLRLWRRSFARKIRRMQLSNKVVCPQVCILVKAASQQFHRVVTMARKPRPHLPVALVMV